MVRLLALASLLLLACGSRSPAVAPTSPPLAVSAPASLAFIPATIAERIGDAEMVMAVDLARVDLDHLLADLPEPLACVRDLEASAGLVVATSPLAAYAVGLPEGPTLACLESVLPLLGGTITTTAGDRELTFGDQRMSLRWDAGILSATRLDRARLPAAPASAQLRALAAHVPPKAQAFILWTHVPERDIRDALAWALLAGDEIHLSARAEGTEPGAAMRWLRGFATGFAKAVSARGNTVDDSWFDYTDAEPLATLEVRLPLAAFRP